MNSNNVQWSKSSFCQSDGCVFAAKVCGEMWIRDSKLGAASPTVKLPRRQFERLVRTPKLLWHVLAMGGLKFSGMEEYAFLAGVAAGEFGLALATPAGMRAARLMRSGRPAAKAGEFDRDRLAVSA